MSTLNRREFATVSGLAVGALVAGAALKKVWQGESALADGAGAFTLPALPYAFDALEPHIDKQTMEIHHDKHHQAYVTALNKALEPLTELKGLTLEQLLANKAEKAPEAARQTVINQGGGHYNHSLFWTSLAPSAGAEPKRKIAEAITAGFGTFAAFQEKMNDSGMKRFGSGWVWLVKSAEGKLEITSSANQDSPVMAGQTPLLGIDVWEHAYYLKYQNLRADYLKAIWNVVNWPEIEKRLG